MVEVAGAGVLPPGDTHPCRLPVVAPVLSAELAEGEEVGVAGAHVTRDLHQHRHCHLPAEVMRCPCPGQVQLDCGPWLLPQGADTGQGIQGGLRHCSCKDPSQSTNQRWAAHLDFSMVHLDFSTVHAEGWRVGDGEAEGVEDVDVEVEEGVAPELHWQAGRQVHGR